MYGIDPGFAYDASVYKTASSIKSESSTSRSPTVHGKCSNSQSLQEALVKGRKRSERARTAANARYGKSSGSRSEMDTKREKNRLAAAKCRRKKRLSHDVLEETYRTASAVNSAMRRQSRELRDQLAHIRLLALQHSGDEQGCQCAAIQRYNTSQFYRGFGAYEGGGSAKSSASMQQMVLHS
ncbi:hypothetical protein LTR37_004550 [Vermiconidia calcicola]|uniref:Uncharacterized protein n=1 Tax=Vermiconidia calcicola TaxID=1690605 RepID=A0ACC3NPW7_9PEZI|nr:hypothetical protein LTR37_004550 [Vermiconidia calcicola]